MSIICQDHTLGQTHALRGFCTSGPSRVQPPRLVALGLVHVSRSTFVASFVLDVSGNELFTVIIRFLTVLTVCKAFTFERYIQIRDAKSSYLP